MSQACSIVIQKGLFHGQMDPQTVPVLGEGSACSYFFNYPIPTNQFSRPMHSQPGVQRLERSRGFQFRSTAVFFRSWHSCFGHFSHERAVVQSVLRVSSRRNYLKIQIDQICYGWSRKYNKERAKVTALHLAAGHHRSYTGGESNNIHDIGEKHHSAGSNPWKAQTDWWWRYWFSTS